MTLVGIIIALVLLGALAFSWRLHRSAQVAKRRQRPVRPGLNRNASSHHRRPKSAKAKPSFLLLGLGIFLAVWLIFSWLGTEEGDTQMAENAAEIPEPVEQTPSLAGRLNTQTIDPLAPLVAPGIPQEEPQKQASSSAIAAGAEAAIYAPQLPPQKESSKDSTAAQAALQMKPDATNPLAQVGLLPGQEERKKPAVKASKTTPPPSIEPKAASSTANAPSASGVASVVERNLPPASAPSAGRGASSSSSMVAAAASSLAGASEDEGVEVTPLPAVDSSSGSFQYVIHLGSFNEKANADRYLARLVEAGEMAWATESLVDGQKWHRVMCGRFNSKKAAESYARGLQQRGLTANDGRYLVRVLN